MAYNKSKNVEAAQKLLNQGKVAQAIAEYQQILKFEPRDQVTLMTIGELYIRQGETFQAIEYFERLAQLFVGDGFLTKAIAVYKRIAKLAPEEIRPLEKLADLYVQQGVMSEARPLFLQLAEIHLKNNHQPEAIALLKKLLLAEPDNLRIQIRLADLYQAMGQSKEAVEAYVSASQRALARGDQAECERLAEKVLKIDASNLDAITVKARALSSQGNFTQAAQLLEQVPGLEKGGEQAELLLDLYLKNIKWKEATALALRVFDADEKNFGLTQKVIEALLQSGQGESAMTIIARVRIPMLDAGEYEAVGHLLNELVTRMPGRIEPHEWLVDTYGRTSDSFRLPDALAQLGDVLSAAGQLERAKEVFERLVDREPESDSAKRKLNDVLRKLGLLPPEEVAALPEESLPTELPKPEAPKIRPSIEAFAPEVQAKPAAPSAEPALDEETQKFIAQSLTDVDLFASYGLTQKAIGLLEAILRRAPRHTPTLEKLLDFVLGASDDRRTAELAAQLEQIHRERGDERSSERFGELRRRFQRAAGLSDAELAASAAPAVPAAPEVAAQPAKPEVAPVPVEPAPPAEEASPEPVEVSAAAPAASEVHEVDLSDEWASALEETSPAGDSAAPPADAPGLAEFEIPVEIPSADEAVHPSAGIPSGQPAQELEPLPSISDEEQAPTFEKLPAPSATKTPAKEKKRKAAKPAKAEEPEFELEQDYELVIEPEPLVPAHEQKPPEVVAKNATHAPSAGSGFASDQFLADLANEIDQLGIGKLSPSYSQPAPPKEKAAKSQPEAKTSSPLENAPLKEVFDEFRAELGEMGSEDEDLETHYNLGIAFREMGLLEEAISEFQKVAKATDHGKAFRYTMQCSTLLGLAFMEKGQPGIAAIWYERALHTPDMEPESILALRYDLGVAQESAGDPEAALKSFSQVYAANIDYRDVAERIAALQKPAR
ncbi:MAG TPA: tetratricopeptide repeat protein [Candidatus Acidoferrum sp.]|nr:tetratricopeptide repeat protein [Candidatus Acidoferrum sp.]